VAYKVCCSCGKHVRDTEARCWSCQSSQFMAAELPPPPAPSGFMDKMKGHVANVKAVHDKHKQDSADEKQRQAEAAAAKQKQVAIARRAAFEQAAKTCPLPLTLENTRVAGGLDLFNDEFVVSVAKEWGWSSQKLTLTTHRVLWSKGFISTAQTSIYLTDIRDVRYHKPLLSLGAIFLETAGGRSIEGLPAASNGAMIRDRLMAMIHWARQRGNLQATPAAAPSAATPRAPDRLDQLRRLGELKAQGILSDEEFQAEKTKVLSQA
jgi:hypothetical protein